MATVMLVTTLSLWLNDGDSFKMLLTKWICWWFFSVSKLSPTHLVSNIVSIPKLATINFKMTILILRIPFLIKNYALEHYFRYIDKLLQYWSLQEILLAFCKTSDNLLEIPEPSVGFLMRKFFKLVFRLQKLVFCILYKCSGISSKWILISAWADLGFVRVLRAGDEPNHKGQN